VVQGQLGKSSMTQTFSQLTAENKTKHPSSHCYYMRMVEGSARPVGKKFDDTNILQRLDSYMFCYLDLIIHKAQ
jgi:hypothetical protein